MERTFQVEGKAWVKGQSLEEELGNPTEEIDVVSPEIGFQRMICGSEYTRWLRLESRLVLREITE